MKKLIFSLILVVLFAVNAQSASRIYDSKGYYKGKVETDGRIYDKNGRYTGRIDRDNRVYDDKGYYKFKVEDDSKNNQQKLLESQPSQK